MGRVDGKTAIVTGGALGIGKATAERLAGEGTQVAVTDLKDDEGASVVTDIEAVGGTARYWHMDVSDEDEVKRVFDEVADAFGGIDVLVNNAGISGPDKPTHEITEAEWDEVMAVNEKGVFFCTKHAIPYMQEAGGGSIINLSSIYGLISAPDIPPYHASKGAVEKGREQLDELPPLGHVGEPKDIADGLLYLASDESKFVTGSELVIDGGYTAR